MSLLPSSTLIWFMKTMENHHRVAECSQLQEENGRIFKIIREGQLSEVNIYLAEAYDYGHLEYTSRPPQIGKGDFILIAAFSGKFDESLVSIARKDSIGIGDMRKLVGALNWRKVWEYELPENRPGH